MKLNVNPPLCPIGLTYHIVELVAFVDNDADKPVDIALLLPFNPCDLPFCTQARVIRHYLPSGYTICDEVALDVVTFSPTPKNATLTSNNPYEREGS